MEPIRNYANFHGADSGFNQGFEHPWWEEMLDASRTLVNDDERWALQAEMARWAFDNVLDIPLDTTSAQWPVGPKLDLWEPMALSSDWLSDWESAPKRGEAMAAEPTPFQHGS